MKTLRLYKTVFFLTFGFLSLSFGQSTDLLQQVYRHIEEKYSLQKQSIGDLYIKSQYLTQHNQVRHLNVIQVIDGIEVLGTGINLAMQQDGKISSVSHHLRKMDGVQPNRKEPLISAAQSIITAASSLGKSSRAVPDFIKNLEYGGALYSKSDISLQDIPVDMGYLLTEEGNYKLVYVLFLEPTSNGKSYTCYVDAVSGESITNDPMTLNCKFEHGYLGQAENCNDNLLIPSLLSKSPSGTNGTYHVLPVPVGSPSHGTFQVVTGVDDPVASPLGWHDDDGFAGADHTDTRGNNVHAFSDRNWDYIPDTDIDGGGALIFNFPFDEDNEPVDNQGVAVTNLFYWSNIMHDFSYRYGFDEAAGNFQEYNYSGQGEDGDYIEAQAQFGDLDPVDCGVQSNNDVDCINNADFGITPDGVNGRMRMFTWDRDNNSKFLDILEPEAIAGKVLTGLPVFGPEITTTPVTGEVVIIDDGSFDPTLACNPVTNQPELEGKIALIDRGVCDFGLKVYYAQEAGAIGAIICNFEDVVIPMGEGEGSDEVVIPSVMITSADCQRIRLEAGTGVVVSFVAPEPTGGPLLRDGSLDNTIIAHEYTHGITNRLTSGPGNSGCLTPGALTGEAEESYGMSEGWSDFFALATTTRPGDVGTDRRGIGTYSNKEENTGRGIRPFPYSTDMSITPYTYDDIVLENVPYGVGAVWCSMIWDLYWELSDVYGWDPDLYQGTGGNNIAIQLIMDGLKLQGCNPGFIEARDAILLADEMNNGGANQCIIWEVFAKRGLGFDAVGGDPDSRSDGKEGFDLPVGCRDELRMTKTMTPEIVAGDNILVTLTITNYKDETLTNVYVEDFIPEDCDYLTGSANIDPEIGNSLLWALNTLAPDETVIITYLLQTYPDNYSVRQYYDDMEAGAQTRWTTTSDPNGTNINRWVLQDTVVNGGNAAWRVGDAFLISEHLLESNTNFIITGDQPVYRFYTYYNTETGKDGGFLEISTDQQQGWAKLEDKIFRNGYPRKLEYNTFAIPNLGAYSGLSDSTKVFEPVYVDLSDYAGQAAKIRYRFGTNEGQGGEGWYIDDVELMDAVNYNAQACIISDQTTNFCVEAPERGTIVDSQMMIGTKDEEENTSFTVMPNPASNFLQVMMTTDYAEQTTIAIYNTTGQRILSTQWSLESGVNQKTMDVAELAAGIYILQVKVEEGVKSHLIIIQ